MVPFFLMILFVSASAVAGAASGGPVSTIDDLAARYSIEKCIECHTDVHDEWSEAMHSRSIIDPRVLKTWRTFILRGLDSSPRAGRSRLAEACIRCHAPQIEDATDELVAKIAGMIVTAADGKDEEMKKAAIRGLSQLSINCIVCHNMRGSPDGNPVEKVIFGPNGAGGDLHREAIGFESVKSDIMRTSEFCARCHHGCPPGMPSTECPTVYSSYREKYLVGGGKRRCQDCHMRENGMTSHRFPGIYNIDNVKSGISLDVSALPTTFVYHLENRMTPAVVLKVRVKNTAGHLIPHG